MWTWITEERADADRVMRRRARPTVADATPDELRSQVCVGSAEHCAELLSRYAQAGCQWVQLWPLGDERRQIELFAETVRPAIEASGPKH